jgi:mono/diheme cytochrome c family protein
VKHIGRFLIFTSIIALVFARSDGSHPLVWDKMQKSTDANGRERFVRVEFAVKNISDRPVAITRIQPSCGCTTVESPMLPWLLRPNEGGVLNVTIDLLGKGGTLEKSLAIESSEATQTLTIKVRVSAADDLARNRERAVAAVDRQAIFQKDCAVCHAAITGKAPVAELFQALCAICHLAEHRASMVPDLAVVGAHRNSTWWKDSIANGRQNTLMPSFDKVKGGPLEEDQIAALASYLTARFKSELSDEVEDLQPPRP